MAVQLLQRAFQHLAGAGVVRLPDTDGGRRPERPDEHRLARLLGQLAQLVGARPGLGQPSRLRFRRDQGVQHGGPVGEGEPGGPLVGLVGMLLGQDVVAQNLLTAGEPDSGSYGERRRSELVAEGHELDEQRPFLFVPSLAGARPREQPYAGDSRSTGRPTRVRPA